MTETSWPVKRSDCFVNAPYGFLEEGLIDTFIEQGLQPEIGLEGEILYTRKESDYCKIADLLRRNSLSCTLHAPFFDLAPGAIDYKILTVSREKLRLAFELISIFKPRAVICHLAYEENKHGYKLDEWCCHSEVTWRQLTALAASGGSRLMLENTYETTPERHIAMLKALDSPHVGFCLDTGHLLAFAGSPWQEWLPAMSPWLGHLHLHDNNGRRDEHLGIGRGKFDFQGLFRFLARHDLHPLITLEPHSEDDLQVSLRALGLNS
ncbi:sugar phosphate isomerase/epimerase family protein [Desulfobacterota bacterium M19]